MHVHVNIYICTSYSPVKISKGHDNFFSSSQTANPLKLGSYRNWNSANFWGVPVCKSQIRKFVIINPQIANPKIDTFAEGPQIKKLVYKFADLRFAELICGPPTFAFFFIFWQILTHSVAGKNMHLLWKVMSKIIFWPRIQFVACLPKVFPESRKIKEKFTKFLLLLIYVLKK